MLLRPVHKEALPIAACVYCAWDPGTERHLALALRGNGVVLWQARARPSRCSSIISTVATFCRTPIFVQPASLSRVRRAFLSTAPPTDRALSSSMRAPSASGQ